MFTRLWQYRHFMASSIRGELKGRFARSALGGVWAIVHPLAQALIFALVLSGVMRARMPNMDSPDAYAIYLLAGMAAWGLFSEILNRCLTVFIDQSAAMKKIAFPRLCLPIIVWGGALINHLLLLGAMVLIFAALGHFPGLAWLYVLPGLVLISALAFGLGVFLGILNVFVRDVGQVMVVIMQLWFWFTPVVYVKSVLPTRLQFLVDLNPMTGLVMLYQNAFLLNQRPHLSTLLPAIGVAVAAMALSVLTFRRAGAELVDAL